MNRRKISVVLIIAAMISAISLIAFRTAKSERAVVVGILSSKTGFMSGHGESIELGAAVAVAKLNAAGGINGVPVRMVVLDCKSDPAVTAERAKELIERYAATFIVGTETSAQTLAAIPVVERGSTPFIYSLDGECKTCSSQDATRASTVVWGSGFTERMVVEPFLKYLQNKFAKNGRPLKVYLVGGDYIYPRTTNTYARAVSAKLGIEIVGEEYSDTATRDYLPVIRRIQSAKPDLLIVTNPGASGVTFMRQANDIGLDKEMAISGFATFDQEAVEAMGKASEGVYVVNRYSMELLNDQNREFVSAFRRNNPSATLLPGPSAAAGGYGAVMVAATALSKGKDPTNTSDFASMMRGLSLDLPQGQITVNAENNIFDQSLYIMKIHDQKYEVIENLGIQRQPGFEGCSVHK